MQTREESRQKLKEVLFAAKNELLQQQMSAVAQQEHMDASEREVAILEDALGQLRAEWTANMTKWQEVRGASIDSVLVVVHMALCIAYE